MRRLLLLLSLAASLAAGTAPAQTAAGSGALPSFAGESLYFRARSSRVGSLGGARMWVERDDSAGGSLWVMHFDFHARVGFVSAEDRTTSWFDAERMATVRFLKRERHPLSKHDEDVIIDAQSGRWRSVQGDSGTSPTAAPLDELSFIYVMRALTLEEGALALDWHFDPERNPVVVRSLGRRTTETGAGTFRSVRVEMRVKDSRRYKDSDGVIVFDLSDDVCRLPLRIESTMPVVGRSVLTLDEYRHPRAICTARIPDTVAARQSGNP